MNELLMRVENVRQAAEWLLSVLAAENLPLHVTDSGCAALSRAENELYRVFQILDRKEIW